MRTKFVGALLAMFFMASVMSMALIPKANAEEITQTASIWTDKADYRPEEIVTIYGTGFFGDATIVVSVTRPDLAIDTLIVTSDADGSFTTTYQLDGIAGMYTVTATDGTNMATTTFTDQGGAAYWRGYRTPDMKWVKANLSPQNYYYEGDWCPYVLVIEEGSAAWDDLVEELGLDIGWTFASDAKDAVYIDMLGAFAYQWDATLLKDTGIPLADGEPGYTGFPNLGFPDQGGTWTAFTPYLLNRPTDESTNKTTGLYNEVSETCASLQKTHFIRLKPGFGGFPATSDFATHENIVIYFQAHLSMSIIWMNGQEYKLSDFLPLLAGTLYTDPTDYTCPYKGSSFYQGAASHFYLQGTGFGAETIPIPIAQYPAAKVEGHKYNDTDADGLLDVGTDTPIQGWGMDANFTMYELGIPITFPLAHQVTNSSGAYSYGGLTEGTIDIKEETQDGWMHTGTVVNGTPHIGSQDRESLNITAMSYSLVDFLNAAPKPNITLTKTPSSTKVENGSLVTYTYNVTNTGNIVLNVTLTDDKFGTIFTGLILAPGASNITTITRMLAVTTTNTATATGTPPVGETVTATDSATVTVLHPGISLVKSGPSKTEVGSIVTFSFNVSNTGDCSLSVVVTDDVLGLIWNGTLGPGTSHVATKNWTATGDSMTNEATAVGTDQEGAQVRDSDTHTIDVLNPGIDITKTGTPASQLAPGTVTWTVTVTNTGDVLLTVDVWDTRNGTLETGLSLDVNESKTYSYTESGLPPGTYTNNATAMGQHQFGSVNATASATVEVIRISILKEFTAVTVLPGTGFNATLLNSTLAYVYGLKSGPRVYFTVQYYFENSLNFLGDDYDGQAHNFTLWDKWGGNLMALGSEPISFDAKKNNLTLADGSSLIIDPRLTNGDSYRGYIGSGLDISDLASQGTAYITMHLGDQQEGTNPGTGKGTSKDGTSYDTDIIWFMGELAPGESATLTVYIAPGKNPGGQLEFTSYGCKVINTGPRVRAYGETYENEDFLYAVERTNTLTVCVKPPR